MVPCLTCAESTPPDAPLTSLFHISPQPLATGIWGRSLVVEATSRSDAEREGRKKFVLATLWFNVAHYAIRPWPWILVDYSLILFPGLEKPETATFA